MGARKARVQGWATPQPVDKYTNLSESLLEAVERPRSATNALALDCIFTRIRHVSILFLEFITHSDYVIARAYTLTGLTNYVRYTVTLHAMVDSTAWLSNTARVMPTDRLVYLPLIYR